MRRYAGKRYIDYGFNPWTLIRLWSATAERPMHIIDIAFQTRLSSAVVYRAARAGWLRKTAPAHFQATQKLAWEVKRYESVTGRAMPGPGRVITLPQDETAR